MFNKMTQRHGIDLKLRYLKSAGQELSNEVLIVQIEQPELPNRVAFIGNHCHRQVKIVLWSLC